MGEDSTFRDGKSEPKSLVRYGVVASGAYGVLAVLAVTCHWNSMESLKPNEWADFLSGVFSPLAFLWLVLGYFQQGQELRLSSDALWLQSQELKNSVEQQRALVEATRQQVDFERSALAAERMETERRSQPIFMPMYNGTAPRNPQNRQHLIYTDNTGEDCTDAKLNFDGKIIVRLPILRKGESIQGWATLPIDWTIDDRLLQIYYTDGLGIPRVQEFRYTGGAFVKAEGPSWPKT